MALAVTYLASDVTIEQKRGMITWIGQDRYSRRKNQVAQLLADGIAQKHYEIPVYDLTLENAKLAKDLVAEFIIDKTINLRANSNFKPVNIWAGYTYRFIATKHWRDLQWGFASAKPAGVRNHRAAV